MRLLFLLFAFSLSAKTVCLNMIVKNERQVIERCLASVKDKIDYWVICDTGSTDGTQEAIQEYLKDIPGELYERPWVNFGYNRNEALQLASNKADYVLFIDADEVLEGDFNRNELAEDVYLISVRTSSDPYISFLRGFMIKESLGWTWQGVVHEKLNCPADVRYAKIEEIEISAEARDGRRSLDPDKYLKDAQTLLGALKDEPDNADYVYYLAQSYFNAGKYEEALKYYAQRAEMPGWDQHTFWAQYEVGFLQEHLGKDSKLFVKSYTDAYLYRPTRLEPLFRLAQHYYNEQNYLLGYLIAEFGMKLSKPNDIVYVEHWLYDWGVEAIFANCAMCLGRFDEAGKYYSKIAARHDVPAQVVAQAKSSLRFTQNKSSEAKLQQ